MNFAEGPDAPSVIDMRRQKAARGSARQQVAEADAIFAARSLEAFRQEVGAIVRSVSPFLIALLAAEGLVLDDVIEAIEPGYGWPGRPRISSRRKELVASRHAFRHVVAGLLHDLQPDSFAMHGVSVDLSGYTSAKVHLNAHSIEVRVRLGTATFSSRSVYSGSPSTDSCRKRSRSHASVDGLKMS